LTDVEETLIHDIMPDAIAIMRRDGIISEAQFDAWGFALDLDDDGNVQLRSDEGPLHTQRAQIMTHPVSYFCSRRSLLAVSGRGGRGTTCTVTAEACCVTSCA